MNFGRLMVLQSSKIKSLGQYFTPEIIVKFMVKCISKKKIPRILEPSAGTGIFVKILEQSYNDIVAIEIDPDLPYIASTPRITKNFFDYSINEKFDLVIGNPPYIRWRNQPETVREDITERKFWNNRINSLADILQAFIFKSIDHLANNGELIFLTPKFWLETLHASNLRKYILENGYIDLIIDFKEKKIVPSVSSNLIIFRFVKDTIPVDQVIQLFSFRTKGEVKHEDLQFILDRIQDPASVQDAFSSTDIDYQSIKHPQEEQSWKLFPDQDLTFIETVEQACKIAYPVMIKDIEERKGNNREFDLLHCFTKDQLKMLSIDPKIAECGYLENKKIYFIPKNVQTNNLSSILRYVTVADVFTIGNGMVSGLDKAFWIEKNPVMKKLQPILNSKERTYLKKVIKARFMNQYTCKKYAEYIFIEENDFKNEDGFKTECPNLFAILEPFKDELMNRWSVKPVPWYVWSFPRNYNIFKNFNHKFFLPCKERFDNKGYIRCVYESKPVLGVQDITVLGLYSWVKESPEYLLAYLNSMILFKWLMIKGLKRGGVLQFSEHPLSDIPVRLINWEDQNEVELHNIITNKVQLLQKEKYQSQVEKYIEEINESLYKIILKK